MAQFQTMASFNILTEKTFQLVVRVTMSIQSQLQHLALTLIDM